MKRKFSYKISQKSILFSLILFISAATSTETTKHLDNQRLNNDKEKHGFWLGVKRFFKGLHRVTPTGIAFSKLEESCEKAEHPKTKPEDPSIRDTTNNI